MNEQLVLIQYLKWLEYRTSRPVGSSQRTLMVTHDRAFVFSVSLRSEIHYSDIIMSAMASQITNTSIVCSIDCSGAYQRKSKLRVNGLCEGNPHVTGGFPSQRASNAENVSIWWRYHDFVKKCAQVFIAKNSLTGIAWKYGLYIETGPISEKTTWNCQDTHPHPPPPPPPHPHPHPTHTPHTHTHTPHPTPRFFYKERLIRLWHAQVITPKVLHWCNCSSVP